MRHGTDSKNESDYAKAIFESFHHYTVGFQKNWTIHDFHLYIQNSLMCLAEKTKPEKFFAAYLLNRQTTQIAEIYVNGIYYDVRVISYF